MVSDAADYRTYMTHAGKELSMHLSGISENPEIISIYFGGGTPSLIDPGLTEQALYAIKDHVRINEKCEITIEANPNSIDEVKIKMWQGIGIGRLSVGIQSINNCDLEILGRLHDAEQAEEAIMQVRNAGWDNVSIDLIFGIPGQTEERWKKTLNEIIEWKPKHVSVYGLTLEKNTAIWKDVQEKEIKMPHNSLYNVMFEMGHEMLEDAGYCHYEISNYSLPNFESKHNSHYWKGGDYLGIGASAHSMINGKRWANFRNIAEYSGRIKENRLPIEWEHRLSYADKINEYIMLGLRTSDGIDLNKLKAMGYNLKKNRNDIIRNMQESGLIKIDKENVSLSLKGMMVSDEITVRLMKSSS